ncbi:MAG: fatty acid desaturase [Lysobacteraceae bacterium]
MTSPALVTDARLRLGDRSVPIAAGETLLQALERAGVDWPSGCRVGACGACRCRVLRGRVHERTESAYLLDADEIAAGTVLACQTEARGEVELAPREEGRRIDAVVEAVESVSPQVRQLVVRADPTLSWRAGQWASVSLPGRDGRPAVARPYSFATTHVGDGRMRFTIRLYEGGAFSQALAALVPGDPVAVDGPFGRFALPAGEGPLLVIGAGTGLPPLLALLEAAQADGDDARPVHLVTAGRDIDALAGGRIMALQRAWRGGLTSTSLRPRGEGRSIDALPGALAGLPSPLGAAALCGPAGFVDRAVAMLLERGLPLDRIATDRFVPAAPVAAPVATTDEGAGAGAGVGAYAKFALFHAIGLASVVAIAMGGTWTAWGLLAIVGAYVLGDALLGDDLSVPAYRHPGRFTALLWSALPLVALVVFVAVWRASPGDPLGFGAAMQSLVGVDLLAARAASGPGSLLAAWGLAGLMIGMLATVPAHELVHRTWDPRSMAIGRALLAFSFDTSFAIEHVHGHHRAVATPADPASAPRGRTVYAHILHSTWHGNASAWRIEAARLAKRVEGPWTPSNAVLRGWALSGLLVASAAAMGGLAGAAFFIACGLWGKALLEIVNYMEHYGLARDPATPVQPRHSWNTNRRVSSWSMFNLTRHSHHHAEGERPFHRLAPMPDAPLMPAGYLTTILLALVPPLWRRLMAPRLADWDARFATPVERVLARVHAEG